MAASTRGRSTPGDAAQQAKILRVGVIQAGKIVEERLIRRRETVTIGASARNTIVVPASTLPRTFALFEVTHGTYHLNLSTTMDGRVSVGDQVLSLEQIRQSGKAVPKGRDLMRLPLTDSSRGKVLLGDITLLFQFVAPPPIQPRPQLPPSVRGSVLGQMDWPLAWSFSGTAAAMTAFVLYLYAADFPREVAPDVIPDEFAEFVPTVQAPKIKALDMSKIATVGEEKVEKVEVKRKKKGEGGKGKGKKGPAKPCDDACQAARAEARRARLLKQVSRMGALKILGAKGKGGTAADLLGGGDPGMEADKAFRGIGGLTVRGGGARGGLRGKGGGGSGKAVGIGDLGGRVGGPGAVETGGRVVERVPRAIVKRAGSIERDSTLRADEVASVVRRGMRAIKGCYQRALKRNPKLTGKIGIRMIVNATGKVTDVEIDTDTLDDSGVTSCIVGYAKRWRFPPPEGGGTAEVAVPFIFQAAD